MSTASLEQRVATLEAEVVRLKARVEERSADGARVSNWEKIYGSFANDPIYDEAMRLGREYRESLRPKPRTGAKRATKSPRRNKGTTSRKR